MPLAPSPPDLIELEGLGGNDLLFALYGKADDLDNRVLAWKSTATEISQRLPKFQTAVRLAAYASSLDEATGHGAELESVRRNRSLLDEPDPVGATLSALAAILRTALRAAYEQHARLFQDETTKLNSQDVWQKLPAATQGALLRAAGVAAKGAPSMASDEELLQSLDQADLASWAAQTDALPRRFASALAAAIRETEPKARVLSLPSATIRNEQDLKAWLEQVTAEIEVAMKDGPVIL